MVTPETRCSTSVIELSGSLPASSATTESMIVSLIALALVGRLKRSAAARDDDRVLFGHFSRGIRAFSVLRQHRGAGEERHQREGRDPGAKESAVTIRCADCKICHSNPHDRPAIWPANRGRDRHLMRRFLGAY